MAARSVSVATLGAAARLAICLIRASIPFFICTSTRVSCDFRRGCEYTQRKAGKVMSHWNDVGVSRQYRPPVTGLYPAFHIARSLSDAQRSGSGQVLL